MKNTTAGEHTLGEWKITHGANYLPSIGSAEQHLPIAHIQAIGYKLNHFYHESEANAKLIAAAPDMLKALEKIVYILAGGNANEADLYLNSHEMQAAINKAKGI